METLDVSLGGRSYPLTLSPEEVSVVRAAAEAVEAQEADAAESAPKKTKAAKTTKKKAAKKKSTKKKATRKSARTERKRLSWGVFSSTAGNAPPYMDDP